jgi:hypothetical protein
MTVNYSTIGSLQGFRATELLKYAMAREDIPVNGGHIRYMMKPHPDELRAAFAELYAPRGTFFCVVHSDDATLAVRVGGKVHWYNVDISSCDTSHGPSMFEAYLSIAEGEICRTLEKLVDQCRLPIKVQSVEDPKKKVVLAPRNGAPVMGSGTTLTTSLNTLATMTLIKAATDDGATFTREDIMRRAQHAGYFVTCQNCEVFEDVQFLKHSPVEDNGIWQPVLNLGVLLRASGQCHGDLPGRKTTPLMERARQFQAALLQGMYPRLKTPFIDNMKAAVAGTTSEEALLRVERTIEHKVVDAGEIISVSTRSLFRRYRLDQVEILDILEFAHSPVGYHYCSSGVDKILRKDYELGIAAT